MTFLSKAIVLLVASLGQDRNAYASEADAGNDTTLADAVYSSEEFFDPLFWHPKSRNFEIIDWEKFEKKCGNTVPFAYDPVQRYGKDMVEQDNIFSFFVGQWGRMKNIPDDVIATGEKPMVGRVSDPDMGFFYGILGRSPNPGLIPEPLRSKAFWMHDNFPQEYLISVNRAAWRKNTPEGRVIGLFNNGYDYTNAPTMAMLKFSTFLKDSFVSFQISPSGKFIKLFQTPRDPSDPTIDGAWLDMYVVQEGDVFTDRNGNVLDYVEPGDIYRLTTAGKLDPYACYDDLQYAYFFRPVAVIDEDTGVISPGRAYDALFEAVTAEPPDVVKATSANLTNSSGWTTDEKFNFLTTYEPDKQMYLSAPQPPPAGLLDDIGKDGHPDMLNATDHANTTEPTTNDENQTSAMPGSNPDDAIPAVLEMSNATDHANTTEPTTNDENQTSATPGPDPDDTISAALEIGISMGICILLASSLSLLL